jgi:hypothetical protein
VPAMRRDEKIIPFVELQITLSLKAEAGFSPK